MSIVQELFSLAAGAEGKARAAAELASRLVAEAGGVAELTDGFDRLATPSVWAGPAAEEAFGELRHHRARLRDVAGDLRSAAAELRVGSAELFDQAASYRSQATKIIETQSRT